MSNFYEDNRALFVELDEVTEAASAAMDADDMEAWAEAAGRGAEIHNELAQFRGSASEGEATE